MRGWGTRLFVALSVLVFVLDLFLRGALLEWGAKSSAIWAGELYRLFSEFRMRIFVIFVQHVRVVSLRQCRGEHSRLSPFLCRVCLGRLRVRGQPAR